ncbi:uncharacterized protein [Cicer arietinum]|uniref:Ricin B-like lectin EULS3 n=1 Tax=Cicer arietinum TaxID=3827 RepID=A0A1S2XQX6_CICAR|nr:ricin B-like lectin EULS3 [Cicer arietinum]
MEWNDGHNHNNSSNVTHTHHHHRRNEDEEYPPPGNNNNFSPFNNHHQQPPIYTDSYPPPQETQVFHSSHVSSGHVSHDNYNHSPPHHQQPAFTPNYGYAPPPPSAPHHTSPPFSNTSVHHVSHEIHDPHFPTTAVHHVDHQVNTAPYPPPPTLSSNKPTFKVVTKASPNYSLTIRRGDVVLAPSDPTDQYQHWYKDEKWSTRVKDKEGCHAFSLVNKVTGEAIKHSIGSSHPVRLVRYNPDYLDQSILWSESRDICGGFRAVRMVNNIQLNMDAFHGNEGVHDGTTVVLWEWNSGDNQQWKILPY